MSHSGSAQMQSSAPMALEVIGDLVTSTLLSLPLVPVACSCADQLTDG
jgi:multidrug efflux pump subunit AcrB